MSKPKFLTPKFIECAIRYVVYFLAVALTPFLAKPIAPLFDWAGYGLMRPMYVEVFTIIFWALEWLGIFLLEKKFRKEKVAELFEKENLESMLKIKKPLPLKKVFVLSAICIVCIFIISAVIGWQVKPIYDLGEKIEGYDLYNKLGWVGKRAFMCFWILGMVKACKGMAEEIVCHSSLPENKQWLRWLIQTAMLLIFALFDVFVLTMLYPLSGLTVATTVYPMTVNKLLIGLTYLLFYVAFVPVQELTEGSDVKAFLLIALIYLF
jgi:hypothetical protein